jgi:tetratricopeptide (TPR) repeat protein
LHLKTAAAVAVRGLVIAACALAMWRSVQFAMADWTASANSVAALAKAVDKSPDDARLLSRLAIARNDAEDPDPEVDEQLRRAARLNPFDAEVLMTLGLREEFEGDRVAAERELRRAAEVDHQYKPAWTLANFYVRRGEAAKAWPMIERILALDPLGFYLGPIFELCWQISGDDPGRVLRLIPKTGPKPVQYLGFLMGTNRADEAMRVWPVALGTVLRSEADDKNTPQQFVAFLVRAGRVADAVKVWNQLVDGRMIQSGRLDPAKGESIADPGFRFPAGQEFAWRLEEIPGVSSSIYGGGLHLELSDNEPELFRVVSSVVPLMPDRRYRLVWKTDASGLRDAKDPGFRFRVTEGGMTKDCPLLTSSACEFTSAAGDRMTAATLSLEYTRAQGTTRVTGTLELSQAHLELMP